MSPEAREAPTFARAVLLTCILGGCREIVNEASQPSRDRYCVDAIAHVTECDSRFPDRTELCSYSADRRCQPYINPEQGQCLRQSTCDAVRAALDRGDWLCGVSMHGPYVRGP